MRCKSQGFEDTELTSVHSVEDYLEIKKVRNCADLADLVKQRFEERYLDAVLNHSGEGVPGFAIVAICCLLIETLQSFKEGVADTTGQSRQMFESFITAPTSRIAEFEPNSFFEDIRCGILHQAETRNGWKIRKGCSELLTTKNGFRILDADKLAERLKDSIKDYRDEIRSANWQDEVVRNCVVKMDAVVRNCRP